MSYHYSMMKTIAPQRQTTRRSAGKQVISIELPTDLVARAERRARQAQRKTTRVITRSDIIRDVLTQHL